jgi:hypothetical protein
MTNDGQNGPEPRYIESPEDRGRIEANLATDKCPESVANRVRTNWAWANGRLGYDWMDSHYLFTGVA